MTSAFHNPTQYRPAPKTLAACVRAFESLGMSLRDSRNAGFTHID